MDIASLISQFGGFGWTILAFVLALSVIVAVHEYGHYIVGRWSGIHADIFSIGFGPVIWSGVDKRGTQWQIAALPFGGYVKFAGDANAASGKDEDTMAEAQDDPVALRRTMHGAPLWARAATVFAGPLFNFVFSAIVFAFVFSMTGAPRDPLTLGEIHPTPVTSELRVDDVVLAVAGQRLEDGSVSFPAQDTLPNETDVIYAVLRDGAELDVTGPHPFSARVGGVTPRGAGQRAGLLEGDVIVQADGAPIATFGDLVRAVKAVEGKPIVLSVWRDGTVFDAEMTPKRTDEPSADGGFETHYRIGVFSSAPFEIATESLGMTTVISAGISRVGEIISGSLTGLKYMISGDISTCNLSGPVGIAQTSGAMASAGFLPFLNFIAVLSTAVGFLNLFPIPALDGGHLVFYAYEAVTGKPPSDTWMRVLMTIGLALVLTLMVFALGNDLFCP